MKGIDKMYNRLEEVKSQHTNKKKEDFHGVTLHPRDVDWLIEQTEKYEKALKDIYNISTFDHDERFPKVEGYEECIRMAREALGIELTVYGYLEKRLPEGTKILSKEDGNIYTVHESRETNNQFGYGIYFYRVKERLSDGFGLYKKWFELV